MVFRPFRKLERQPGAIDMALDELLKGERVEANISTLQTELANNPDLFKGREDEVISALQSSGSVNIGPTLNKLQAMKEKRLGIEEGETREMPALKVSEGLEKLVEEKLKFKDIAKDFDDLAGFIGSIRQMAGNEKYFEDPEFIDRFVNSVDIITDAVSTWQNPGEKKELEKRYARLMNSLPADVREKVMRKVA